MFLEILSDSSRRTFLSTRKISREQFFARYFFSLFFSKSSGEQCRTSNRNKGKRKVIHRAERGYARLRWMQDTVPIQLVTIRWLANLTIALQQELASRSLLVRERERASWIFLETSWKHWRGVLYLRASCNVDARLSVEIERYNRRLRN